MTFSAIKANLDAIAAKIAACTNRQAQARAQLATASAELAAMATTYAETITAINGLATQNPDNPAAATAKAEKDLLVAEYQALKVEIDAQLAAFDAAT